MAGFFILYIRRQFFIVTAQMMLLRTHKAEA